MYFQPLRPHITSHESKISKYNSRKLWQIGSLCLMGRGNNSSGQFRRSHQSEGTQIEILVVNWPCTFLTPTHGQSWVFSIHHSNQLHFQAKCLPHKRHSLLFSERYIQAIRRGQGKVHIWQNKQHCVVLKEIRNSGEESKLDSKLSLSPFEQEEWWIRRDSLEVST